jgi:Flp pilus assembly protein TadG
MSEINGLESDNASQSTRRTRRRSPLLSRFIKNREGATAIEFSLVALPFFALLFAIIETALIFWSTQVLETAVADASRKIYTGQFQSETASMMSSEEIADKFRDDVCERVVALFNCQNLVRVDIQRFPSGFPGAGLPLPVSEGNFDASEFNYAPSGPSEIVVVRAAMAYPVIVSLMNPVMTNLNGGKRLIMASAAFRNEPFSQ